MSSQRLYRNPLFRLAVLCLLPVIASPVCGAGYPREDGPVGMLPENNQESAPWKEQSLQLPAYPQPNRLLEIEVDAPGFQAFIDPDSLSAGKDMVVRFTSVLVSSSGVWNVTYEGLHCGADEYRRLAYGVNGSWKSLDDTKWLPLTDSGSGSYRKMLYYRYFCNPVEPYRGADVMLRRMQSSRPSMGD